MLNVAVSAACFKNKGVVFCGDKGNECIALQLQFMQTVVPAGTVVDLAPKDNATDARSMCSQLLQAREHNTSSALRDRLLCGPSKTEQCIA